MFRILYLDNNGRLSHKGNFDTEVEAVAWVQSNNILALRLLKWDDDIDCFKPVMEF